ncbi:MAG: hypothetical protein JNL08_02400 [Planctomycetes bacterium]|nr:hypothetical protein [Planctomycetota bacterium]
MQPNSLSSVLFTVLAAPVFAQGLVVGPAWPPTGLACGDVNADGRDDATVFDAAASLFRVIDSATGTFLPHLQRAGGGAYVGVGDYDGDGADDLAHREAASVTVVSGRTGATLATLAATFVRVGGADVDGDGLADLLLEEPAPTIAGIQAYMWVVSTRTGAVLWQFSLGGPLSGGVSGGLAAIGDENGDGLEDCTFGSTVSVPISYQTTCIVRGPASLVFGDVWRPLGDLDGDGRVDAITASTFGFGGWRLVAGGSGATLASPGWIAPTVRRLDDVDGDGRADFYVIDPFTGLSPRVLSGATLLPLPGFVPPVLPESPFGVGDRDGDGRQDLVAAGVEQRWVDAALPTTSRMVRRGIPGTTHDGRRPKVVARGHAGLGNRVFLDVRGALPNGAALLVFGAAADVDLGPFGAPGSRSYTTLDSALLLGANAFGVASYQVLMPVAPSLLGAQLSVQAAAIDGLANALGLVASNAIDVTTSN